MREGRRAAREGVARRDWLTDALDLEGDTEIPAVFPDLEGYQLSNLVPHRPLSRFRAK